MARAPLLAAWRAMSCPGRCPAKPQAAMRVSRICWTWSHICMLNVQLKEAVMRLLPRVQTPAQYIGGELNSVVKDHRQVRGKIVLAFPDTYTLGMSHHGLQVLYTLMNNDPQW